MKKKENLQIDLHDKNKEGNAYIDRPTPTGNSSGATGI